MRLTRRQFLEVTALAAASRSLHGQSAASLWGGQVIDTHLHIRRELDADIVHMDGCGVSHAVILARDSSADQMRAAQAKYPGRLMWAASSDITSPDAERRLTEAVKAGALGFGEMKFHVAADSPEFQRMYALAADLNVPILIHFQEVPHFEGEGVWATGFKQFETMLRKFSRTTFIGHADAFWANVDAKYANESAYPTGPITRGGITDRLLADYANLFGDLSANSGNNALSRDPGFTSDFLRRHQDKLLFGSDCACADGRGTGVSQASNPGAARLAGKCVARETLALLKQATPAVTFRKLTWDNAHRVYRIPG
jgi:predicted TIM-barrel fold metal-dependent hydrolase